MNMAHMTNDMDIMNWRDMRAYLSLFPLAVAPKDPLMAKAGEKEVI